MGLLGVHAVRQYEKYLGLPSFVSRSKKASFSNIKERVWNKLQGWKHRFLSQAGKEILIKAVVQAISAFSMSCFKLLVGLCHDLEVLIRQFWGGGGSSENHKKIHLVRWSKLCQPMIRGNLGFRDLKLFNDSLLAKQLWRLCHCTDSLFYRVFKEKFFRNCTILDTEVNPRGSYAWRSIFQARTMIQDGGRWRVGDGSKIKFWGDNWVDGAHTSKVISPRNYLPPEGLVSCLIDPVGRSWKHQLIHHLFLPHEATNILGMSLSSQCREDKLIWPHTSNDFYSVRSAYRFLINRQTNEHPSHSRAEEDQTLWKHIWSLKVIPRVKSFIWKACLEVLPTKSNLHHRHIIDSPVCEECHQGIEDAMHALWHYKAIKPIWVESELWQTLLSHPQWSLTELLISIMADKDESTRMFAVTT